MRELLWGKILNQSSISNAQIKRAVGKEDRLSFRNAVAVLAVIFCLHSHNSLAVTDDTIPFNIPQQRADTALTLFAEQANLTLVFPFDKVREKTANRLVGDYPVHTAVKLLLDNTGLTPTFSDQLVLNIAIETKGKSMNIKHRKSLLATLVGLFAAGGAATATAQDEMQESARAQNVLDEIIVTAEKREASLQKVPIAITAFTGDQLANAGIDGSEALELVTPGMSFLSVAELGVITIRGVGSPFLQGSALDPSTSVYIDGVYQSRFTSAHLKLMDIERVEVLKGPQGVLYGRNSPGGAVNYITRGPQNELGGKLNVSVGNYDLRKVQGQIDIPIIEDKLLFRGAIHRETRDGYSENLLLPSDALEEEDLFAARFALQYMPSENIDIILRAGISDREGGLLPAFKVEKIDPTAPNAGMEIVDDPRKINADQPNYTSFNDEYVDLTINFDMDWATLSSISAYIDREVGPKIRDVDGSELALGHQGEVGVRNGTQYDTESFSQEFLLASNGDEALDWVLGAFYFEENPFIVGGFDAPFVDSFFVTTSQAYTEAYAIFGHASYELSEKIRLNAGIRYSSEDREQTRALEINSALVAGPETVSDSWSSVTPKIGIDYFINDDTMTYVSFSQGFKSGGFESPLVQ
jgi:iron complex outermembrane recepter protein